MVEVLIKELKYIQYVPDEMLKAALDSGELRKGKIVGLMVRPIGVVSEEDVLIELRLSEDGQAGLLKAGVIIPIESSGSICYFGTEWPAYLERLKEHDLVRLKKDVGFVPTEAINDRRMRVSAFSE